MWWIDPESYYNSDQPKECDDSIITRNQQLCYHDWIPIMLLTSTVYDCKKCQVKKEVYDSWVEKKN